MKSGFAAASLLLSFAMVALTVVLVPLRLDEFGGAFDGTVNLAVLIGVGIVVAMFMTAFASAMSDRTRASLGRRTPWLIGGTVVATLFAFALSACHTNVAMILVWVFMQLGYAVMAMACSAMVGEMVPDKFRNAVATWRNVAMFAGSLAGAAFAAGMADHVEAAMDICARCHTRRRRRRAVRAAARAFERIPARHSARRRQAARGLPRAAGREALGRDRP